MTPKRKRQLPRKRNWYRRERVNEVRCFSDDSWQLIKIAIKFFLEHCWRWSHERNTRRCSQSHVSRRPNGFDHRSSRRKDYHREPFLLRSLSNISWFFQPNHQLWNSKNAGVSPPIVKNNFTTQSKKDLFRHEWPNFPSQFASFNVFIWHFRLWTLFWLFLCVKAFQFSSQMRQNRINSYYCAGIFN